jgi:hypothetical protein
MEWKDYKPPVAATFPVEVGRTFVRSYENLVAFGKFVALVLAALVPWAPLLVLSVFVIRWLTRTLRTTPRSRSPVAGTRPSSGP